MPRKVHITHQAGHSAVRITGEKRFGRRKHPRLKAVLVQQALETPAHVRIVFHDHDRMWSSLHVTAHPIRYPHIAGSALPTPALSRSLRLYWLVIGRCQLR